jgi:hypothetical protein
MNNNKASTRIVLGIIARIEIKNVPEIKRTLTELGCQIVYTRLSTEPLYIVGESCGDDLKRDGPC